MFLILGICLRAIAVLPLLAYANCRDQTSTICKCFPGDSCWPGPEKWGAFNNSLGGKLIATVPLASPCHDPNYDAALCSELNEIWMLPQTHYVTSSSIMAPWFTNESCDPFSPTTMPCLIGNYAEYAVNISRSEDVVQAISFASRYNIRFVIRNTGHDYNGKSTGSGALSVWVHNLKNITFLEWNDDHYQGKAIKMGAGVQGIEAYEAANEQGLVVVGGECPTVGLAGGYTQGAGHSALASRYGLAADQTLEFEVVTAKGETLKVNRKTHADLYWAFSGGGGGTFAVVMSLTSKAHPDMATAGLNLTMTSKNVTQDVYYSAIQKYHATLPSIIDAGAMSVWFFDNVSFTISPLTGPGITSTRLEDLIAPFTEHLKQVGITYTLYAADFPSYLAEFNDMQAPIAVGIAQYGGWLIPRRVVETANSELTQAYRDINNEGGMFIGVGVNVSRALVSDVDNAVLPAWRETLIDTVITTPYIFNDRIQMMSNQKKMTENFIPSLKALAPQSGVYLSESDFQQPDWQNDLYGANYPRLLAIKDKYDPEHLFYAWGAVGSEYWKASPVGGKMCEA